MHLPPWARQRGKIQQEAPHTPTLGSLWNPFSHPSSQKADLSAAQGERMERSQTSKFWGPGVGFLAFATGAKPRDQRGSPIPGAGADAAPCHRGGPGGPGRR